MKQLLLLFMLPLFAMSPAKLPVLEWELINETAWDHKTDETNNTNVWIPSSFSPKLMALEGKEVLISGYVSVNGSGDKILTRVRRSEASLKDRSAEPPDFIVLNDFGNTYTAPLKKYEISGRLDLNGDDTSIAAFQLHETHIHVR